MTFTTKNTTYTLVEAGDGAFLISGHPRFCPTPQLVTLDAPPQFGERVVFTYVHPWPRPYVGRDEGATIYTTTVLEVQS